jgi:hypothetical protein
MAHDPWEIGMLRLACLLGLTVLALTAVTLASTQKSAADRQPEPGDNPDPGKNRLAPTRDAATLYPVRFSLN